MVKVYIGWDPLDVTAYDVCRKSLYAHATNPKEITVAGLQDLRLRRAGLYRRMYYVQPSGQKIDMLDGTPHSTEFTYTRYLVPFLNQNEDDWAIYMDPDMMWRADVHELIDWCQEDSPDFQNKKVWMVKHNLPKTLENQKMGGLNQKVYERKWWTSLMVFPPGVSFSGLTPVAVSSNKAADLHGVTWAKDDQIGELSPNWNYLVGINEYPSSYPGIAHFTLGTPDLLEKEPKQGKRSDLEKEWWSYT